MDDQTKRRKPIFGGALGKQMMILQGYVPPTCTLPDEYGGGLIYSEINAGRDPCAGCNDDRAECGGRPRIEVRGCSSE